MRLKGKTRDSPLSEDTLLTLISGDEGETIEFKQHLLSYEKIAEYAVGIGNAGGGLLILGVSDKPPRHFVGIDEPSGAELHRLKASVYNATDIRLDLEPVKTKSGAYILGIRIPRAEPGQVFCTHAGRYLIRVGESLVGMSPAEVSRRLRQRPPRHFVRTATVFVLVSVITAVVLMMRNREVLAGHESVVLADLSNDTGDANLASIVKQSLGAKLEESPFLSIVSEQRVREALHEMRAPTEGTLLEATAREICRRENANAMIGGRVSALGRHLVIGVNAVDCQTGDALARDEVEADSREHLLVALDRLTHELRHKLGESAVSIQQFDTPLERATTASLDALQDYTLGNKELANGSNEQAIRFFERAIQQDQSFAMAYAKMGQAYDNLNESDKATECARKAFQLREGTTRRERFYITARYHDLVSGDATKEIEALEDWKVAYPFDWMPRNDLADNLGEYYGRFDQAIAEAREAVRLNPKDADMYVVLADSLMGAGQATEARSVIERAFQSGVESPALHITLLEIAFLTDDNASAQEQRMWFTNNSHEDEIIGTDAQEALFAGRVKVARDKFRQAAEPSLAHGLREAAGTTITDEAVTEAEFGNFSWAKDVIEKNLSGPRKTGVLINAAMVFSMVGETERSEALITKLHEDFPNDSLVNGVWLPIAKAANEIRRGNSSKAIALLEVARPYEGGSAAAFFPTYLRGQAYLRKKEAASAVSEFQRIIEHRGVDPTSEVYVLAHLSLARAWRLSGNIEKSRAAYRDFFGLWKDADPDIPVLLEAKAEYAKLK